MLEEGEGLPTETQVYFDSLLASLHSQKDLDTIEQLGVSDECFIDAENYGKALKYIRRQIRSGKKISSSHIKAKYQIDMPKSNDDPTTYANEVVFYAANAQADEILGTAAEAIKGAERREFYEVISDARNNLRGLAGPLTGALADVRGGKTVRYEGAGSLSKPKPQEWLVRGVVPDDWPTFLYGSGGSAKSYLATLLALSVATGTQFLGIDVPRARKVLYLDWEMDEETFRGRVNRVARGMKLGLKDGISNLMYRRLMKPLVDHLDDVAEQVEAEGVGLVIIDSFGFSMTGMDTTKQPDVTAQMARIALIPAAVVIIDHIAKEGKGELGPFGSIYKHAAARWMWWCRAASKEESPDGEVKPGIFVRMVNAKHNIAAQQNDIYLHIEWDDEFDANTVRMKRVAKEVVPVSLNQDIKEPEKNSLGTTSRNVMDAIDDCPREQVPDVPWLMKVTNYTRVPVDKALEKLMADGEVRKEMVRPEDADGKKLGWRYAYYHVGKTVPAYTAEDTAEDEAKV